MHAFQGDRMTIQYMYVMCNDQSKVVISSGKCRTPLFWISMNKALLWAAATTDLEDITTSSPVNCPSVSAFLLVCLVAPTSRDHCFYSMKVRFLQEYDIYLLVPGLFYVVYEPTVEWPLLKDTNALTGQSYWEWSSLCQNTNKMTETVTNEEVSIYSGKGDAGKM